jgi:hypothetical protein
LSVEIRILDAVSPEVIHAETTVSILSDSASMPEPLYKTGDEEAVVSTHNTEKENLEHQKK